MPYYCTVPRCTSMAGKAKNVSFHQFPRDEELAKLWNRILKRGKPYTKYSKVCSLHFKPEDYTITSVGKNKGQWRTLRKDAIPSQNLPSESPAPYTRRNTGYWAPAQPSLVDPMVQQQMAQAIYMQTMLAMQAAGASEPLASSDQPLQMPEPVRPSPSGSALSEIELLLRKDTETSKDVTFKCQECSKCFKDPDVFILHKRTHKKDTLTNNIEKENYSANIQDSEETLRANPILANLLKTSMRLAPESSISNILTVENQIMTALASNMEAYIRTLTSMLSSQNTEQNTSEDKSEDKSESDDYEEEANDDKYEESSNLHEESDNDKNKIECEDNDLGDHDDNMGTDMNETDTPMEEDMHEIKDNVEKDEIDAINKSLVEDEESNGFDGSYSKPDKNYVFIDANIKHTTNDENINDHNGIYEINKSVTHNHTIDDKVNSPNVQNDTLSDDINNPSDEKLNEHKVYEEKGDIDENEPTSDDTTEETVYEGKNMYENDNLIQSNTDCDSIIDKVTVNC